MNEWGVPMLTPSLLSFGTCGHYATDNGFNELADRELKDKNRKTVGYYRLTSPVVLTIDTELINAVFTTHFSSFSARQPEMGSFGVGKGKKMYDHFWVNISRYDTYFGHSHLSETVEAHSSVNFAKFLKRPA